MSRDLLWDSVAQRYSAYKASSSHLLMFPRYCITLGNDIPLCLLHTIKSGTKASLEKMPLFLVGYAMHMPHLNKLRLYTIHRNVYCVQGIVYEFVCST